MYDPLAANLLPQPQVQAPDPQLKSEWDGWLSNPANRAALANFGLTLMAGGWGGPAEQVAVAAGQGIEAAVGTQQQIDAQAEKERTRGDTISAREDNQKHQLELERMQQSGADRRAAVGAGASRTQARWDRYFFKQEAARAALQSRIDAVKAKRAGDQLGNSDDPDNPYNKEISALEQRLANMEESGAYAERMAGGARDADAGNPASAISDPGTGEGIVAPPQTPASGQRGDAGTSENIGAQTPTPTTKVSSAEYLKQVTPESLATALKTEKGKAMIRNRVADWVNIPGMVAPTKPVAPAAPPTRGGGSGVNSQWLFNNLPK